MEWRADYLQNRLHFLGSAKPAAQRAVQQLIACYGQSDIADASYVVAIGRDGTALNALHAVILERKESAVGTTYDA